MEKRKGLIKTKKQMFIVIGAFALVLLLGTTTYAFFNYTRTGASNTIKVGRISFVSKNEQTITLNNLFPIDPSNSTDMNDSTKVGTYSLTIEGDTDYSGGIEYLVSTADSSLSNLPISIDMTVGSGLGANDTNYFISRDTATTPIYKKLIGGGIVGDGMLLVGFIPQNTTIGTSDETGDTITIKAYLDKNKILISDTYDGTESDSMGTPNSLAKGKTVLTTTEWNALSSTGISFKIKVEANEGIWVKRSLDDIIRVKNISTTTNQPIMDNVNSDFVQNTTPGIDFGAVSSDTNGKGIYMMAGTENDAYPILYYRGAVEDNNVLFNNKCWKAVRTTETGGVKLIYNGEQSMVLSKEFTDPDTYASENAGDMFTFDNTDSTWNYEINDGRNHEISIKVPAGENYNIVITGTTGSTCGGGIIVYKDGNSVNSTSQGGGNPINYSYSYGTLTASNVLKMLIDGSGTSSTCGITVKMSMQQNTTKLSKNDYSVLMEKDTGKLGCDNTETDTYIDVNGSKLTQFSGNDLLKSPAYNGYMWGTVYESKSKNMSATMKFGAGFTYNDGMYTLTGADNEIANTRHYTCFTTNDTCDGADVGKVYYVYYKSGNYYYYIELENGKSVEDAMAEMQTNTTSSNAKTQIDSWYASNMNTVTSKLEDTIWCNDRSFGKGNNNGWISNGGDLLTDLYYGAKERSNQASNNSMTENQPSLACTNKNDAFTVSNGNGNQKLTYPVAMLTEDEMVLAGGLAGTSSTFYLNNGRVSYWSLSPHFFSSSHASGFVVSHGGLYSSHNAATDGLRPAISIKQGLPITKGSGTVLDPYVIE